MDFTLNQDTESTIKRVTGMTAEEIRDTDIETVQQGIEKKIGKKLSFGKEGARLTVRGNAHIALGRFFMFDRKKMDKRIDSIK
ncbi:MAG: hypothetical protein LBS88_02295 [Tannerellaceae bacterium]|jgi:hypothetical protein|nr:hypothetical protein [Tannerellaceae bacterium]